MATLTTPPLAAGDHNFIAVYSGDDYYQPSTSAAATVSIENDAVAGLTVTGASSVAEGTEYDLTLPTDDGYGNPITQWLINWGDGSPAQVVSGSLSSASYVYVRRAAIRSRPSGSSLLSYFEGTVGVAVTQAAPSGVDVTVGNVQYSGADTEEGGSLLPEMLQVHFTGPASAESDNVVLLGRRQPTDDVQLNPGQTEFDYPLPQYANNGSYPITVTNRNRRRINNSVSNTTPLYVTYSNALSLTLSLGQTTFQAGSGVGADLGVVHSPIRSRTSQMLSPSIGPTRRPVRARTRRLSIPPPANRPSKRSRIPHRTSRRAPTKSLPPYRAWTVRRATIPQSTVTPAPAEVMIGEILPAACQSENSECIFAVTCGGGSAGSVTVNFSLGGYRRLRYHPGLRLIGQRRYRHWERRDHNPGRRGSGPAQCISTSTRTTRNVANPARRSV